MRIQLNVNGREVVAEITPTMTLASCLRNQLGLTGTKLSCEVGECGSCTVLLNGRPVTSCLVPAAQAAGGSVETVEALALDQKLHPLQKAFITHNAVQCGFCIPGMLMAAKALLDDNQKPTSEEVRHVLSGNLCRCTGYQKIVEAILAATKEISGYDG